MDIFKKWFSYQNVHVSPLFIYMIHEASMSDFEQKCFLCETNIQAYHANLTHIPSAISPIETLFNV